MLKNTLIGLGILITLLVAVVVIAGPMNVVLWMLRPKVQFVEDKKAEAPDYSLSENWAALPSKEDLADLRPEDVAIDTLLANVDVFFIHPTGYLKGDHWNFLMDPNTGTEQNTQWMMSNQASAFSDCNVYAPRYRQATIFSFFDLDGESEKAALDLAYQDVVRAFDYFISQHNQGKPFILAAHSQGSYHGMRLIQERVDPSPDAERMIAAYLIGMHVISNDAVTQLMNISVCEDAYQTNCIIHWATFAENAPEDPNWGKDMVCVNPLSWKRNYEMASSELNKGFVPTNGIYNLKSYGNDEKVDAKFGKLEAPIKGHTSAICINGRLIVEDQDMSKNPMGEGNYHGIDFQLFHMNIRQNVSDRVRAYLANNNQNLVEI
jgi:hypothetical protein